MDKRIGKKHYNTESARLIAEVEANKTKSCLYLKQRGEYFLYQSDNLKEEITPITASDAKQWLITNKKQSEYDLLFGYVNSDSESLNKSNTIKVDKESMLILNRISQETGRTKSDIVRELIFIYAGRDYSPKKHDE